MVFKVHGSMLQLFVIWKFANTGQSGSYGNLSILCVV